MARKKEINGNKFIKFRISKKMYELIKRTSEHLGISMSETCRSALELFFMGLFLGRLKNVESEFYKKYHKFFEEKTKTRPEF